MLTSKIILIYYDKKFDFPYGFPWTLYFPYLKNCPESDIGYGR